MKDSAYITSRRERKAEELAARILAKMKEEAFRQAAKIVLETPFNSFQERDIAPALQKLGYYVPYEGVKILEGPDGDVVVFYRRYYDGEHHVTIYDGGGEVESEEAVRLAREQIPVPSGEEIREAKADKKYHAVTL